jgi:ElaB/YqjD/DUF883 family membrane-anchored ribosome-binding protein
MDQSTEMSEHEMSIIRSQMDETRTNLTDKLEQLEQRVTNTVQGAADTVENMKHAVEDTVSSVKNTVQETVTTVKSSLDDTMQSFGDSIHAVGEAFNISHHVERHPWAMMAGATAVGFVGGYLLMSKSEDRRAEERFRHLAASQGRPPENFEHRDSRAGYVPQEPVRRDATRETTRDMRSSSHSNAFLEWLKPATSQIQGLAIGAALGLAKELVNRNLPKPMTGQVNELFDGLTTSLGGQVMRGPLLDQFGKARSS